MSDFDKEAEREKLREKFEQEEDKRAATEQMSELLLKGATMTNAHCTECGDPVFRYDGQEFCPTCQKPVAREQSEDADDRIEVADPSDDAHVQFGDGTDSQDPESTATEPPDQPQDPRANAGDDTPPADATAEIPSADPDRTPPQSGDRGVDGRAAEPSSSTPDRRRSRAGRDTDSVGADLSAAESLLAETVHRFSQRAADTDDPRTAREHLAAAREAAEALDAVRF